jgi:hypothetical protein
VIAIFGWVLAIGLGSIGLLLLVGWLVGLLDW